MQDANRTWDTADQFPGQVFSVWSVLQEDSPEAQAGQFTKQRRIGGPPKTSLEIMLKEAFDKAGITDHQLDCDERINWVELEGGRWVPASM